ncbi:energy transducer TonB [uncultured Algibacter sp.]|uniref:energy transducer TonB n=1 Tax=uncultured Algibacter sp. TaxID=298659 RepID=UPI003217ADBB
MKNLILILFLVSSSLMFSQKKQKHGPFESFYKSGELKTSGQYREGKKIGMWQDYYKSGKLQKKYTYNNGKNTGVQENYYKSGELKNKTVKLKTEGFIKKGFYEGGVLFYEMQLSRKSKSDFLVKNGLYHEFFKNNNIKVETNYKNDQLVGSWVRYYDSGEKEWEVNYYSGYKQGDYVKYFKNGQIELKGSTVLGVKHGLEKRFTEKGLLILEGTYVKDKLDGKWVVSNESENNTETVKFKEGILKKSKSNIQIEPTKIPYGDYQRVPVYPGCESSLNNLEKRKCMSQKIATHVNKNFNTDIASKLGLQGRQRINIIFKINKQGLVTGIRARAPHKDLEKEAITVIKKIPKMIPGMQWGEAVNVPYSLPIIFMVNGKKKKEKDPFGDLFTN